MDITIRLKSFCFVKDQESRKLQPKSNISADMLNSTKLVVTQSKFNKHI